MNNSIKYNDLSIYETYILKMVDLLLPSKRTSKFSNKHYLDNFNYVLHTGISWKYLKEHILNINLPKNHWGTIKNKFKQWTENDIFNKSYYDFIKDNQSNLFGNNKDQLDLLIDVTKINNFLGSENVAVNCEYTKKNVTEICIISIKKIPIGLSVININTTPNISTNKNKYIRLNEEKYNKKLKYFENKKSEQLEINKIKKSKKLDKNQKETDTRNIKIDNKKLTTKSEQLKNNSQLLFLSTKNKINKMYSVKEININNKFTKHKKRLTNIKNKKINKINNYCIRNKKTFCHELSGVQKTLDTININIENIKKVNLIADKGYITQTKFYLQEHLVNLICPTKINQKNTSFKNKLLLKKRYVIENFFANLKKDARISLRKDKKIKNYLSFVFMRMLRCITNIIDK